MRKCIVVGVIIGLLIGGLFLSARNDWAVMCVKNPQVEACQK